MDIIQDTIKLLKQAIQTTPSMLVTAEEYNYFCKRDLKLAFTQENEPLTAEKDQTDEMRVFVKKKFPHFAIRETILEKQLAEKKEDAFMQAHVIVVSFGEGGKGLEMLDQMTGAIDSRLMPARLIEGESFEKEAKWNVLLGSSHLRFVICSPLSRWKQTSLATHYHQSASSQEQFLGRFPLLLLEPSELYLAQPDLKRKLWKSINTQLSLLT